MDPLTATGAGGSVPARVVRLAGRELRVRFLRDGDDRLIAEVVEGAGCRLFEVSVAREGGLLLDGEPLEGRLATRAGGGRVLHTGGASFPVEVLTEAEAALAAGGVGVGAGAAGAEVRAPMPGRVLAVEVEEGASVAAGAELFIIEAMKMENEIRAPRAGRVRGLRIATGDAVEGDQLLCEIAAAEGQGAAGGAAGGTGVAP